jgi:hypothetical protein
MPAGGRFSSPWFKLLRYGFEYYGKFYACYRGVVINNNDPDGLNRLQIKVPALDGNNTNPTWAWSKGQWGGKDYGMQILPNKGDLVWVEYINGDARFPVWLHHSFSEGGKPEEFSSANVYGFKSPKGNSVVINDDEDRITIKNSHGEIIEIIEGLIKVDGKEVNLGSSSLQPALKGDDTWTVLNNILTQLQLATTPTALGPMPLVNLAAFTQIQAQDLPKIKSTKVKVE